MILHSDQGVILTHADKHTDPSIRTHEHILTHPPHKHTRERTHIRTDARTCTEILTQIRTQTQGDTLSFGLATPLILLILYNRISLAIIFVNILNTLCFP